MLIGNALMANSRNDWIIDSGATSHMWQLVSSGWRREHPLGYAL